jgi:hypothetical protein
MNIARIAVVLLALFIGSAITTHAAPPRSGKAKIGVKKPTTLVEVAKGGAGEPGGYYTLLLKDQDGNPIKNADVILRETITNAGYTYDARDAAGTKVGGQSVPLVFAPDGPANDQDGTDAEGKIADAPVGQRPQDFRADSILYGRVGAVKVSCEFSHDKLYYIEGFQDCKLKQLQTVTQVAKLNAMTNVWEIFTADEDVLSFELPLP